MKMMIIITNNDNYRNICNYYKFYDNDNGYINNFNN